MYSTQTVETSFHPVSDVNSGETLVISLAMNNGDDLPDFISYTALSWTVSPTIEHVGAYLIDFIVTDSNACSCNAGVLSSSYTLLLNVREHNEAPFFPVA